MTAVPSLQADRADRAGQPISRAHRVKLIIVLGALSAFGPLSLDMYLPAFPSVARDLAVPDSGIQLTLTSCLLGLALGQLAAGPLSDSRGRRGPLLIGLAGYAAASLACAFAPSAPILDGLRLVQGIAGAAGIVISRAIVRDLYDGTEAARFFSLLMLVNGLAPILAPLLGGQLLRIADWRGIFAVLAIIGALLLAATLTLPETLPAERRSHGGPTRTIRNFGTLLRDRRFLGYALPAGLAFAAMFSYISGSSFVLQQVYGLSAQQFSLVFGGNALGIVLLGQGNAWLLGRLSPQALLRAGLVMSALGGVGVLLAVTMDLGLPGVCGSLFLLVAAMGLVLPNSTALSMAGAAEQAGTASALLGLLQFALGGLAAPLVGLGGSGTALPMAVVIAGCSLAALPVYALCTRDY